MLGGGLDCASLIPPLVLLPIPEQNLKQLTKTKVKYVGHLIDPRGLQWQTVDMPYLMIGKT